MKNGLNTLAILLLLGLVNLTRLPAQDRFQPLFLIERSTNANVVHYDARIGPQGSLQPAQPVVVYWKMHAKDGHREDLTSLEKKRVFGISVAPQADGGSFLVRIAAQPARDIRVFLERGAARAETSIAGKRAFLQRLFISTGKLNIFRVNYIDVFGLDVATGAEVRERIAP